MQFLQPSKGDNVWCYRNIDGSEGRRGRPVRAARGLLAAALLLLARPGSAQGPAWEAVHAEALGHLQRLIRINTVNPPGNELPLARYLDSVLAGAGIETRRLEPAPGRAALVARLRGSGAKRPVLLVAHMDVVGVERDRWSVDPFAADIRDGYLYGRGAIDDKGMLAVNLQTMLLLKRHLIDRGGQLARDVIFVATADEEAGGELGIGWLIAHHPDLIRAEFALNEGGRVRVAGGRPLYVAVQTTEKVPHNLTVIARGPGGHASVPLPGNAIVRLGRALAAVGAHREPLLLTPTTRRFFAELARVWPDSAERRAMAEIGSGVPSRVRRGAAALGRNPTFDAVLRNGISATLVSGGIRRNVIPGEARANLNVRTLPGEPIGAVIARLRQAIADTLVTLEATDTSAVDAPASSFDTPMFGAIAAAARALDRELVVVPYLSTGATDSARLRAWGVQAYGVLPFPLEPDDEARMHGTDERLPLAALDFGLRLVYGTVRRVAG